MNWKARPQGQKYQSVCTFIHVFHWLKPFKKKKRKRKHVRACPVPPYTLPANYTAIKADQWNQLPAIRIKSKYTKSFLCFKALFINIIIIMSTQSLWIEELFSPLLWRIIQHLNPRCIAKQMFSGGVAGRIYLMALNVEHLEHFWALGLHKGGDLTLVSYFPRLNIQKKGTPRPEKIWNQYTCPVVKPCSTADNKIFTSK